MTCVTVDACTQRAIALGLSLGGGGWAFSSTTYNVKGCYAYSVAPREGWAFFGAGGTVAQMQAPVSAGSFGRYRVTCETGLPSPPTLPPPQAATGYSLAAAETLCADAGLNVVTTQEMCESAALLLGITGTLSNVNTPNFPAGCHAWNYMAQPRLQFNADLTTATVRSDSQQLCSGSDAQAASPVPPPPLTSPAPPTALTASPLPPLPPVAHSPSTPPANSPSAPSPPADSPLLPPDDAGGSADSSLLVPNANATRSVLEGIIDTLTLPGFVGICVGVGVTLLCLLLLPCCFWARRRRRRAGFLGFTCKVRVLNNDAVTATTRRGGRNEKGKEEMQF